MYIGISKSQMKVRTMYSQNKSDHQLQAYFLKRFWDLTFIFYILKSEFCLCFLVNIVYMKSELFITQFVSTQNFIITGAFFIIYFTYCWFTKFFVCTISSKSSGIDENHIHFSVHCEGIDMKSPSFDLLHFWPTISTIQ